LASRGICTGWGREGAEGHNLPPFRDPDEAARQVSKYLHVPTKGNGGIRESASFPRLNSMAAVFVQYDTLSDNENRGRLQLPQTCAGDLSQWECGDLVGQLIA